MQGSHLLALPALEPAERQLVQWLWEIGLAELGAHGLHQISWAEIDAWARTTGTPITPEDAFLLRDLSAAYVSAYYEGEDPGAPPPYRDSSAEPDHDAISRQLLAVFRAHPKYRKCNHG